MVGGSDPCGGAGVQADIKTVTALGGYASAVVTAVTAQNTGHVGEVSGVSARHVAEQLHAVLSDVGADVIKTGMLATAGIVSQVATLAGQARVPLVVDPVLIASSGGELLSGEAREILVAELLPKAALVTPNVPEAETLSGVSIASEADMSHAADILLAMGAGAVLVKGGHLEGDEVVDLLRTVDGVAERFVSAREAGEFHGTGCTLAAAIAFGIGDGLRLVDAIEHAKKYLGRAMRAAHGFGGTQRLLNHSVDVASSN